MHAAALIMLGDLVNGGGCLAEGSEANNPLAKLSKAVAHGPLGGKQPRHHGQRQQHPLMGLHGGPSSMKRPCAASISIGTKRKRRKAFVSQVSTMTIILRYIDMVVAVPEKGFGREPAQRDEYFADFFLLRR